MKRLRLTALVLALALSLCLFSGFTANAAGDEHPVNEPWYVWELAWTGPEGQAFHTPEEDLNTYLDSHLNFCDDALEYWCASVDRLMANVTNGSIPAAFRTDERFQHILEDLDLTGNEFGAAVFFYVSDLLADLEPETVFSVLQGDVDRDIEAIADLVRLGESATYPEKVAAAALLYALSCAFVKSGYYVGEDVDFRETSVNSPSTLRSFLLQIYSSEGIADYAASAGLGDMAAVLAVLRTVRNNMEYLRSRLDGGSLQTPALSELLSRFPDEYDTMMVTGWVRFQLNDVWSETVIAKASEIQATCIFPSGFLYVADFTSPVFSQQFRVRTTSDPLGHDWGEPVWTWSEDLTEASATFECRRWPLCTASRETVTAGGDAIVRTETPEAYVYTATVTLDGKTYRDSKTAVRQYTVRFLNCEEAKDPPEPLTLAYGSPLTLPETLHRTDHRFLGWYEDPEGTVPFLGTEMPARDLSLYAKWEENEVVIEAGDGTVTALPAVDFVIEVKLKLPAALLGQIQVLFAKFDESGRFLGFGTAVLTVDGFGGCTARAEIETDGSVASVKLLAATNAWTPVAESKRMGRAP